MFWCNNAVSEEPKMLIDILRYAAPTALAAQGECIGQKSGVMQIGLEGTLLFAAFGALVSCQQTQNPWIGLLFGTLVGLAVAMLSAWFSVSRRADQVIVGTAINLLGLGVTGTLARKISPDPTQLLSVPKLPTFGPGFDLVILLMLGSVPVLSWLLGRTRWGLLTRGSGEYPAAIQSAGVHPNRMRYQALAIGGLFAGLSGAYLTVGLTGTFAEGFTSGRGFIAIALVTFGRFKPYAVFGASLLIGIAEILQFQLQARGIQAPPEMFTALPYVLALGVLMFVGKGSTVPASLGLPYPEDRG
jgi:general nucleoside transport system permease protein